MIRTLFACDRCGAESSKGEGLYHVGVMINSVSYPLSRPSMDFQQQWCASCCEQVGLKRTMIAYHEAAAPKEPATIVPTLEDMIIELIDERLADR